YYQALARLPRKARRALQRRWRRSLGGLALLLALGQAPALAVTINVDGTSCTLVDAIKAANSGLAVAGCPAGIGPDTIVLAPGSTHTLSAVYDTTNQTGLPLITSTITIQGNGSTITRAASAPAFGLLAVDNGRDLTLQDTTLSGGLGDQGGAAHIGFGSTLSLIRCTVTGNSASVRGGGVYGFANSTITLANTTVSANYGYQGGGVSNSTGTLTLTESTVSGNSAEKRGGGVYNTGTLSVSNSTISGNSSSYGGGGVFSIGSATLTNSTVSGNSAYGVINGVRIGFGGGLSNSAIGRLTLTDSTVSGNSAANQGGGVYNRCGIVTLTQTLVSGNLSADIGPEVHNSGFCSSPGSINADAANLFGHAGYSGVIGFAPGASDLVPAVPLAAILDPVLGSNGGPTTTHALVTGSPAVDVVPAAGCAVFTDQRGFTRPHDGDGDTVADCDIGAFELGAVPAATPPPPPPPPPSATPPPGPQPPATCRARAGCGVILTCLDTTATCTSDVRYTVPRRTLRLGRDRSASGQVRRRIAFASAVVNVPPGGTGTFKLQLTKNGRKILRRNLQKRLKARLEVRDFGGAIVGNTPPITLRLRRPLSAKDGRGAPTATGLIDTPIRVGD
ncbi:MAG: choice-of-anchor Q domain-containing protein, partial [Gammaproteobacteria bacterium]